MDCHFLVECDNCVNCSGLVKCSGKRDLHIGGSGASERFEEAVLAAIVQKPMLTDVGPEPIGWTAEQGKRIAAWVAQHWTGRHPRAGAGQARASPPHAPKAVGATRIALLAKGSRGDVQPVVALALHLTEAGFRVQLFANRPYDEFARSLGVDTIGYTWTVDKKASSEEAVVSPLWADAAHRRAVFEGVKFFDPDLLLYRKYDFLEAWVIEDQLRIPTVEYMFDWHSFPENMGMACHFLATKTSFDRALGVETLKHWSWSAFTARFGGSHPVLVAVSGLLAERPPHLPAPTATAGFHTVGSWCLSQAQQTLLLEKQNPFFGGSMGRDLRIFLAHGERPIYIGWGSMVADPQVLTRLAVCALMATGRRGIVLGGESGLGLCHLAGQDAQALRAFAEEHVLWLKWAPHEWLMRQCSVIVHHGGAGTTAAALRGGRPMVITPFGHDQPGWGALIAKKGLGVATPNIAFVQAGDLAAAIEACEAESMVQRANDFGEALRAEAGAARTVEWLRAYMMEIGILQC